MSKEDCESQDCIDKRTRRALEECMTVLPDHGHASGASELFIVVGENENGEYLVDTRTQSCECKDAKYRDPEGGCKHLRRCRIATGEDPVPANALDKITIDSAFGSQLDTSAKFATADGGLIDGTTGEPLDEGDDESGAWSAPKAEIDKHGRPTGSHYVVCEACGGEAMTGANEKEHKHHCEHREDRDTTATVSPCRACSDLCDTEYCSEDCREGWNQRDVPL